MRVSKKNVLKLLKMEGINLDEKQLKRVVGKLVQHFTLIPQTEFHEDSDCIFHNADFGFFKKIVTEEEIEIYLEIWRSALVDWKLNTDEPMGIFEYLLLDTVVIHHLEILRCAGRDRKLEVTPGMDTWIAFQSFRQYMRLMESTWARPKSYKKREKKKDKPEPEPEPETETVYVYEGKEMTKAQFDEWSGKLDPGEKVKILGHVKTVEREKGGKSDGE